MKWNQKGLVVCFVLFVIVLGIMAVQSVKKQGGAGDAAYASEEDMFSLPEQSDADRGAATGKAAVPSASVKPHTVPGEKSNKKENTVKKTSSPAIKPEQRKKTEKETGKTRQETKTEKTKPGKTTKKTIPPTKTPAAPVGTEKPVENTVSFEIQCKAVLDKQELWKEGLEEIIPKSGVFYSGQCIFTTGETVYDLLKRICKEQGIALDSTYTPLYGSYYVRGIGNLYEFDCGSESGWKYAVNDEIPGVGSSQYKVQNRDKIVFFYDYQY